MSRERVVSTTPLNEAEEGLNITLRPGTLNEYIGQKMIVEKLSISLEAAKGRNEPVEHILFYGPPGLGKTTLANIIANEMQTSLISSSGPALTRAGDLMGVLSNLNKGDVLFIDEIHRLTPTVEEFIYPAMEDYKVDFIIDKGAFARTINIPLKTFTLVGATTRAGFLSAPLRERFGIFFHLDFYSTEELMQIVKRSASLLDVEIDDKAVEIVASRSRGTPRIANRLLRRVRDFTQVKHNGVITAEIAVDALEMQGIDKKGLDPLDRKYMSVLLKNYGGGPAGIEALGATINEEIDTLEDVVEPYLLSIGFLQRTKQGRRATDLAWEHFDIKRTKYQGNLFDEKSKEMD